MAREQKSSRRSWVLMSRAAGSGRRFACDRSTRRIPKRQGHRLPQSKLEYGAPGPYRLWLLDRPSWSAPNLAPEHWKAHPAIVWQPRTSTARHGVSCRSRPAVPPRARRPMSGRLDSGLHLNAALNWDKQAALAERSAPSRCTAQSYRQREDVIGRLPWQFVSARGSQNQRYELLHRRFRDD